ncbi:hypothetical protein MRX96_004682 [Rhipicephalus microplus]
MFCLRISRLWDVGSSERRIFRGHGGRKTAPDGAAKNVNHRLWTQPTSTTPGSKAAAAKGSPLREKPPRSRRSKGQDFSTPASGDAVGVVSREVCARELLCLVRGSSRFTAEQEELEQLVEELLNRAGQPGGEWRKRGPDPEAHLRRLLAERERDLEAERQHALSHATKVKELRQELNQQLTRVQQHERSLKAQQKVTEEQAVQLQRLRDETRQLQQRVHQLENELQQTSASVCERVRSREKELEQAHQETLEQERQEAEAQLAQAQQQVQQVEATCAQLQQLLDQEAQNLAAQRNASEGKVKELSKVHQLELEAERTDHQRRLDALEQRCQEQAHLAEELRARLAEAVQTHSREVSELSRKKAEAEVAAEGAEQRLAQAHEAAVQQLRRELDDQRAKNNDLRTKNWEAVEAMRAAERKAEAKEASLTKKLEELKASHTKEIESLQQRLIDEQRKKERELLERLLPAIKVDAGLSHAEWLVAFERELHQWQKWQQQQQQQLQRGTGDHQALSASTQSQTSGVMEDVERLQQLILANAKLDKEVSHYKQVLSQTEDILQNLQRSVEEEEKRWHEKEEGHNKERLLWQQQLAKAQAEASQQKNAGSTGREKELEERCAAFEADLQQLHGLQEVGSLWKRPRHLLNRLCSSMLSLARSAALHAVGNIIVNALPPNITPGNHLALLDTRVAGMNTKNLGLQLTLGSLLLIPQSRQPSWRLSSELLVLKGFHSGPAGKAFFLSEQPPT